GDQTLSAVVHSLTGTQNQVLVNGTYGTQQHDDITLTLPQNIHTGASPSFVGLTLSGKATSAATSSGDASTTLTTKGYVDDEINTAVSGTTNTMAKFTGGHVVGNSSVTDDGTTFGINANKFTVDESTGNTSIAGTSTLAGSTVIGGLLTLNGLTHLPLPISGILAIDASNHVGYRTPAEIFTTAANNWILNQNSAPQAANFEIGGSGTIGSTLTVGGASTFGGNMSITGSHTLSVGGNTTVGGTLAVSGATTTNGITDAGGITTTTLGTSGAASIGGTLDMNLHPINNVTDPTNAQDAATKFYVDDAVSNEAAARIAGDNTLTTNLASEVTRAEGAESTLTTNLGNEVTRATGAETTLQSNINAEAAARAAGDAATLSSANGYTDASVATEAAARQSADNTLTANLNNEITTRTNDAATYLLLDGTRPMSGALEMNVNAIYDVVDPMNPQDAATKHYVDNASATQTAALDAAVSGTPNRIAKFTGTNTVGNSLIYDDGTNVGIGTATPSAMLSIGTGSPLQVDASGDLSTSGSLTVANQFDAALVVNPAANPPVVLNGYTGSVVFYQDGRLEGSSDISADAYLFANLGLFIAGGLTTVDNMGNLFTQRTINTNTGYQVTGAAPAGTYLRGDGTNYVSSSIQASDIPAGSGNYIQNGTSPQSGSNFNIDGNGTVGQSLTVNGGLTELGQANINTYGNASTMIGSSSGGVVDIEGNNLNIGVQPNSFIQLGSNSGGQIDVNTSQVNFNGSNINVLGRLDANQINSWSGYELGGTAPLGHYLRGDGNNYVDGTIQADDIPSGSGNYIQNGTSPQVGANFNIGGNGTVGGNVSVGGNYQIGGSIVLSDAGSYNLFAGVGAGNTGSYNTFTGFEAGNANTSGLANTISGAFAGTSNTTGNWNTFAGAYAGNNNSTGDENTFSGQEAGFHNMTGNNNTFSGSRAGINSTGSANTFLGREAGASNTTGSDNTFSGAESGASNMTGNNITVLGYGANVGADGLTNATAIGAGAVAGASNTIQLGNGSVTDVYTAGRIHAGSDLVLGSGANATTLSSTATSARAINLPNAAGTLALSGRGATYQATPASPTGTSNTGYFEQMGLAGSITPNASGKVFITISGTVQNSTAGDGAYVGIDYGTGTAPANGVGMAGTAAGSQVLFTEPGTGTPIPVPFSTNAIVTGLTVGTTYWIDLIVVPGNGGTAKVSQLSISAMEMP
ncbi:MAG: hypothetical protein Q8922_13145, partial [Bacteroidota bacterium]|nr:hypothetical protein [Bacteroidota bacterium]